MGKRLTIHDIVDFKSRGEPIAALAAYDYFTAKFIDRAGADIILIGDSMNMVVYGEETTLTLDLEQSIYHTRAVARAVERALVVGDMPFLSYQPSPRDAVFSAGELIRAGAQAVKLEGGRAFLDHIGAIAVCLLIVQAAYRIVLPAVGQLIDTALPSEEREAILRGAQACEGVEVAHALRTRQLGSGVAIDLHIEVEPSLTITEAHDIAEHVKDRLIELFPDIIDVVVHAEPLGHVSHRGRRTSPH